MAKTEDTTNRNADDLFKTEIKVTDFAKGLAQLPRLGDVLRLAGVQDGRTMAGVRITTARMNALRAKAIGDPRAAAKAARAEAQAKRLAGALRREEARIQPVAAMLAPLVGAAGQFRLLGKVLDKSGSPVPYAKVEIGGAKTGVMFTAETDSSGQYDLTVPVGAGAEAADDGEPLAASVAVQGKVLQAALSGLIKDGTVLHRVLTVPLADTLEDLGMPIARTGRDRTATEGPARSAKSRDLQEPTGKAGAASATPQPPPPARGASGSEAKAPATKTRAAEKRDPRKARRGKTATGTSRREGKSKG